MDEKIEELEVLIYTYKNKRREMGMYQDFETSVKLEASYNDIINFAKTKM